MFCLTLVVSRLLCRFFMLLMSTHFRLFNCLFFSTIRISRRISRQKTGSYITWSGSASTTWGALGSPSLILSDLPLSRSYQITSIWKRSKLRSQRKGRETSLPATSSCLANRLRDPLLLNLHRLFRHQRLNLATQWLVRTARLSGAVSIGGRVTREYFIGITLRPRLRRDPYAACATCMC